MKNKSLIITLIVILSIISILLTAIIVYVILNKDNSFYCINDKVEKTTENIIKQGEFDINNITDIDIDITNSDINLIITNDEKLKVIEYSNKELENNRLFKENITDKTIKINEENRNFNINFLEKNKLKTSYDIYIPKIYESNLEINSVSADIELNQDMKLKNLKLNCVSGNIKISSDIIANNVDIKTISGDIEIDSIIGSVDMETTSGEVKINNLNINSDSNVKTISGNVKINISKDANCKVNTKTVSGELSRLNKLNVLGEEPYNNLNIKTTSGDIQINKEEK